jgi:small nuclear ribonucleoprotein (snRNP)-like protein
MSSEQASRYFSELVGKKVVVDLKSSYVCLGTLRATDDVFLELADADLHDFRDSAATREVYVYNSIRLGIRRNRARVLLSREDVVAITRFDDILES